MNATSSRTWRAIPPWRRLRALGLLLPLCWGLNAWPDAARPPAPATLSLAQALAQSWARDPMASALQARLNEAQAGVALAGQLTPGPASISLNHLSDRLNQNQGRREWELEWATPMWLPGQQAARQRSAEQALADIDARLNERRLQLAGELREAWWRLALAQAGSALARRRVQTAQALEQDVQKRWRSGDLARLDANLASAERLSAEAEALEAAGVVRQAASALQALTGQAPPLVALWGPPVPQAEPDPQPDAPLTDTHPQLQALRSTADLAASRVALVDASRRDAPELALRWTTQRGDALNPYDQAVGIKLTLPLSSSDRVRQDSAGARAELNQAEQELTLTRERLQQAVRDTQAELATAQQQLAMATQRQALTAENLRLTQRAFDLGEQDLATLLRARAADHEAQAVLQRQHIHRHATVSRLRQAQGLLPETQP